MSQQWNLFWETIFKGMGKQTIRQTIRKTIAYWAKKKPQTVAICCPDSRCQYDYLTLDNILQKYHTFFNHFNIKPKSKNEKGDVFVAAFPNSKALLELVLGAYYNHRTVTALNLVAGKKNIYYILHHCKPKAIFANPEQTKNLKEILVDTTLNCPIIELNENFSPLDFLETKQKDSQEKKENNFDKNTSPEDIALLMYTSGTTGNPKGVALSHKNLLAGGRNTTLAHELATDDVGLCVLPLYHINAQCVSLMSSLVTGSTLVLMNRFSVQTFFPTIKNKKITWASVVPTMLSYLLSAMEKEKSIAWKKSDIQSLKFIRSASAPLPVEIHQSFEKLLNIPIIETMGITETSAQILANPRPPKNRKIGSVGLAFGNQVQIVDKNKKTLPVKKEGEICVRGDNVMQGYYLNEVETKKSILKDGWFLSGDLGIMDEEGYVFVSGRKKELIIKGGENISPRELDEILYSHSSVIEAAVFGRKDKHYGQVVEACIVTEPTVKISEAELINLCVQQAGTFKSPEKIHFMKELPKGPSGKIQRLKLESLLYPE